MIFAAIRPPSPFGCSGELSCTTATGNRPQERGDSVFEHALILLDPTGSAIESDLGLIAQALVFYDRVTVATHSERNFLNLVVRMGERATDKLSSQKHLDFQFIGHADVFGPPIRNGQPAVDRMGALRWEDIEGYMGDDQFWSRFTSNPRIADKTSSR